VTLERQTLHKKRSSLQFFKLSMIFSENRFPPPDHVRGRAFSGSCYSAAAFEWPSRRLSVSRRPAAASAMTVPGGKIASAPAALSAA
jgi:hypothetical protein